MNIACADGTVLPEVRAILQQYAVAGVREQGPNFGSSIIWVMVDSGLGQDAEDALRREITQISGATIRS